MGYISKHKHKIELINKLFLSQKQRVEGDTGKTLKQVMLKIRALINANR